jgi:hypothetical protein
MGDALTASAATPTSQTFEVYKYNKNKQLGVQMRCAGISSCMADQRLTIPGLLGVPLRQVARTKEKKAVQPMFLSSRDAFEREGQTRDGLEGKFQLVAGEIWLGGAHVVSPMQ